MFFYLQVLKRIRLSVLLILGKTDNYSEFLRDKYKIIISDSSDKAM